MTSIVGICRMALDLLGDYAIADLSDNTKQARLCDRNYPVMRDAVLRAHSWNCAMTRARLPLMADAPAFVSEADAGFFPEDKIVLICTGSQGEPRAALSRVAEGTHPHVTLGEGDVCIYSSRQIPGNEVAIARIQNKLASRGVADDVMDGHIGAVLAPVRHVGRLTVRAVGAAHVVVVS